MLSNSNSSDDSSDDDEKLALLREATDQSLINDSMFKNVGKEKQKDAALKVIPKLKSQRNVEHDECSPDDDLKVSESMQNFVYKKLSGILQSSIEFIDIKTITKPVKDDNQCSLKLLKGTNPIVIQTNDENEQHLPSKHKAIEKRKLPNEVEPSNDEKIKTSIILPPQIEEETKAWNKKPKSKKLFQYKQTILNDGKRFAKLIEPNGEFTKLRRKNNWNESNIARK